MRQRTIINKAKVIEALNASGGIVQAACKSSNVGRTQFYEWMKTDEAFKAQVEDIYKRVFQYTTTKVYCQAYDGNEKAQLRLHSLTKNKFSLKGTSGIINKVQPSKNASA